MLVVEGDESSPFGRDLITTLKFDTGSVTTSVTNEIEFTHSELLGKFPSLFSLGLGYYANKTFSLSVDLAIAPKFYKSRPVSFALKPKVNTILDALLDANILERGTYSHSAAAIIPIVTPDGLILNLRILYSA